MKYFRVFIIGIYMLVIIPIKAFMGFQRQLSEIDKMLGKRNLISTDLYETKKRS